MNGCLKTPRLVPSMVAIFSLAIALQTTLAAEPSGKRETDSIATAQKLSIAFRAAVDQGSPGLVTIFTMRGPHQTEQWKRLNSVRQSRDSVTVEGAELDFTTESADEQGSGIVIDPQGLILTCQHVVASADVVFVVLPNGQRFEPAEILFDPESDLALLRIENDTKLPAVKLGNSDELAVGDWVISFANPYELTQSVSAGIVSAVDRWVPGIAIPMIQNDAATNPGSSGGALLNLQGEVVGIVNGGFGTRKEVRGIGLAVPINTAKRFIRSVGQPQSAPPAHLGCQTQKLPANLAQELDLPVAGGLYVKDVEAGSPAAIAKVQEGDIITHFDGIAIDDSFKPEKLYDEPKPGERHELTLYRDKQKVIVEVVMAAYNSEEPVSPLAVGYQADVGSRYYDKALGIYINELSDDAAENLGYPRTTSGLLITEVEIGGPAYKEGLAAGMVLLRLDNRAVIELEDWQAAMTSCDRSKPMLALLLSGRGKHLVVFEQDNVGQRRQ